MICRKCGNVMPDNAKFCTNCGAPLAASQPAFEAPKTEAVKPSFEAPKQEAAKPAFEAPKHEAPKQPEIKLELPNEAKPTSEIKQETSNIDLHTEPDLVLPPFDVGIDPPKDEPAAAYASAIAARAPATTPRDGRGKYIVKRLIFFGIAIVIAVIGAFLLKLAFGRTGMADTFGRGFDQVFMRLGSTLILIIVPLIIAFIFGLLAALARRNGGKNTVRVISAILRGFVPMGLAFILIETFAIQTRLLPVYSNGDVTGMIMPLLSLTLPLIGFLMNAAVSNGHNTYGGNVGAVAAWIADHIIIIVLAEAIIEVVFSVPGVGSLILRALAQYDIRTLFMAVLVLMILTYLLKLINDVIASLTAGGDPTEQVFGVRVKGDKSGRGLMIVGIIFAAVVVATIITMAFSSAYDPVQMDAGAAFLTPGQGGHILGTDQFGRDVYALLASGLFHTVIAAGINTIIALILGIIFGVLAGFLRGAGAEIFKAIRYVFGFGAPIALMIVVLYSARGSIMVMFFLVGFYGWGGIADRLAGAIKAKKAHPGEKTALILPVLEQVVHTFCMAIIGVTIMGMSGLVANNPSFMTMGTLLASSTTYLMSYPFVAVAPAFALAILLIAFFLLHAGLSAKERYLK